VQPLVISRYSIVNCLGAGSQAVYEALCEKRSGLAPCDFDEVKLDTWIGRVRGLESTHVRTDLATYDCRNNRLAQLGLELDGFAGAVAWAYGDDPATRKFLDAAGWEPDGAARALDVDDLLVNQLRYHVTL